MISRLRPVRICTAALVLGFGALPAFAGSFSVLDLGSFGSFPSQSGPISASYATGINDAGQVVGWSYASGITQHAFLYQGGVMHDLGLGIGAALNASGQVAGATGAAGYQPASFTGGVQALGALPGGDGTGRALGINNSGVIVGAADVGGGNTHAFRYQGGTMQDLGTLGGNSPGHIYSQANGINAAGQIVGVSTVSVPGFNYHAFLYQNGALTDLGTLNKNGGYSAATAINSSGQIVGYASVYTIGGLSHAFLYDHGQMHDLGSLNGDANAYVYATGINDQGQIVGFSAPGNSWPHAWLYEHGQMYDLNDLIPAGSGWKLFDATGINDLGQIVGYGPNWPQGETHAFLLNPTDQSSPAAPEPGSLVLLGLGAVGLAGFRWFSGRLA